MNDKPSTQVAYTVNKSSEKQICEHLCECAESFVPRLETRVNIEDYSSKIRDNAVTFEAWDSGQLVGLTAAYNAQLVMYVTSVSVVRRFQGNGIAKCLLAQCIEYAGWHKCTEISLEVARDNLIATRLYSELGFTAYSKRNVGSVEMQLMILQLV